MMLQQVSDVFGDVRGDGKYYSLKEFIQPEDPLIQELSLALYNSADPIATAQDFVHKKVRYMRQNGELWRYPAETLLGKPIRGDCDDSAILLCSLLRNYLSAESVYVAVGNLNSHGHAWIMADDRIIESTASSKVKVNTSKYSPEVLFNDKYCYAEPNDFGFILISRKYNFKVG